MCFFAIKDIEKVAELMFNYNWTKLKGKKKTECLCSENKYTGFIEK
jgi:SET domain-containing protein